MLDLTLAIAHHLAVFSLLGILVVELCLVNRGMSRGSVLVVARADLGYGVLAVVIVVVGFLRAIYAAKGWPYYSHNAFFWAKIGTFVLIAVLSIPPTVRFIQWRRRPAQPSDANIAAVRPWLWIELALLALLPAFAAAMARGYGEFAG